MKCVLLLSGLFLLTPAFAQTNVNVRVMSANLNGDAQTYQPFAIRIFQGTKPDVVAIQEFNYTSTNGLGANTAGAFREMLDTAFGTNFSYYREPFTASGDIPNGIISRWPIVASGSWTDTEVANRGFGWAQIQLPGTNFLYVVSVHLLTSSASERGIEATELKTLIQSNFPTNAWVVLAGDFNTDTRTEAANTTCNTYLSDYPIPVDNNGNSYTSVNRNHPHDYVLPSFAFTNRETATVFPSHSFPSGLVFDSNVYTPLTDAAPVQAADSGQAQHMAVMKDFTVPTGGTVSTNVVAPAIAAQPQGQSNVLGAGVTFSVTATGSSPLAYQWRFGGTNISGATTNFYSIASIQATDAGNYAVVVTNSAGSITSSVAVLAVITAPVITTNPVPQAAVQGGTANFSVAAAGIQPLSYQWRFNGTNISGATTNPYSLLNVQPANGGNYSVVVTNNAGGVTSSIAALTVTFASTGSVVTLAGWDMSTLTAYGPSPMPATTNASAVMVGGLTRGSGVTTTPTAAARTWGGNGFSSTTAAAAVTAGLYATFSITAITNYTVSFSAISQLDYKRSGSGPPNGVLQYQVGAGAFTDITNLSYSSTTGASLAPVNLSSIAALQYVAAGNTVTFRFVNYGGTTGNWYLYDLGASTAPDLAVQGIINTVVPVTPPGAAAVLTAPSASGGHLGFNVSGTTGAYYIVLSITNLSLTNWLPVFTNVAPFSFGDTNLPATQKFYRVLAQ